MTEPVREPTWDEVVAQRRISAGLEQDPKGPWALALSGGGIRSATFCLGLVRGLAKNGLLTHFDYLSTVSGGGYFGASLGRLYGLRQSAHPESSRLTAQQVQEGVASDHSLWLWWLRNNGRYLTPAGVKDLAFAGASVLRGMVATHLEIGALILLLAALVLLPHAAILAMSSPEGAAVRHALDGRELPSLWLLILVFPVWWCFHQVSAYWYTRDSRDAASRLLNGSLCIAFGLGTLLACLLAYGCQAPGYYVAAVLLAAPVTAFISEATDHRDGTTVSALRLTRTRRLAFGLWFLAAVIALACLDWISGYLTHPIVGFKLDGTTAATGGSIAVLSGLARPLLSRLQRRLAARKRPALNIMRLLNVLGIVAGLLVAVFWICLLRYFVFFDTDTTRWNTVADPRPLYILLFVSLSLLAYLLLSLKSFDLLNLASLHNYYRARIERAYVSSGNFGDEKSRFKHAPLEPSCRAATEHLSPLTEAVTGDDIEMEDYRPHLYGGPIHLVNCCVNQTVDDRTGLYNADRKGVSLVLSALSVETGSQLPLPDLTPRSERTQTLGKLSKWIAISGAAAGSGMGSQTSPGLAALLFMSGIRLGYWTERLTMPTKTSHNPGGTWLQRIAPKPVAIVAESLARFPGLNSPLWYASDGGHFDNTAIYALLKRRVPLIVAADCGADPTYRFGDVESLIRKARIDCGADITFLSPASLALLAQQPKATDAPECCHEQLGHQWLLLAKIRYGADKPEDVRSGTLIVVKPRRMEGMPFELAAYAQRNAVFPQQTTGDQFFDEAQWEAYHQLGLLMGKRITSDFIAQAREATR